MYGIPTLVTFFHVLSGFTLAYVYPAFDGGRNIRRFWLARVGRIWPLHMFATLAVITLLHATFAYKFQWWLKLVYNILLVQTWYPWAGVTAIFNAPSWTLSTEMALYLLFPALIRNWGKTWHYKLIATFCLVLGVLFLSDHFQGPLKRVCEIDATCIAYSHPFVRIAEFMLGMVFCLLWSATRTRRRPGVAAGTLLELGAVAAIVAMMLTTMKIAGAIDDRFHIGYVWGGWIGRSLIPMFAFAVLIYVFSLNSGKISALLNHPRLVFMGELSFGIYVLQYFFLVLYSKSLHDEFSVLPLWLVVAAVWVCVFITAHAAHRLLENPARDFFRGLMPGSAPAREPLPGGMDSAPQAGRISWMRRWKYSWLHFGELAVAAGLAIAIYHDAHGHARVHLLSARETGEMNAASPREMRDLQFGKNFVLKACVTHWTPAGLQVDVAWESLREQPLQYMCAVHFVGDNGKLLGGLDHELEPKHSIAQAGDTWVDTVTIPNDQIPAIRKLGLGLYMPGHPLLQINGGERDWGGGRVLMAIPPRS